MKCALVGVGQAGGKVTTALANFDTRMEFGAIRSALAVNTATADLQPLPLDTVLIGQDRVNGHGVGGDNELGAEVMESDLPEVMDALDDKITSETEAVFVIAGLGGGTGSGGAPVLVRRLKRIYNVPIYAIGILPGKNEGALYQANAGRSLKTVAREADSLLLVDNDAWRESGESVREGFDAINKHIAQRLGLLLAAGEAVEGVGESVVDSSEVINTLATGGISALGYGAAASGETAEDNINTVTSTTRSAMFTGMSLPGASKADTALLVVAGRPEVISRKGVERARRWLEEETGSMEVRGGDFPLSTDRLASLILLGGVEQSDRLERFIESAREAVEIADEERADPAEAFDNEALEDLF